MRIVDLSFIFTNEYMRPKYSQLLNVLTFKMRGNNGYIMGL